MKFYLPDCSVTGKKGTETVNARGKNREKRLTTHTPMGIMRRIKGFQTYYLIKRVRENRAEVIRLRLKAREARKQQKQDKQETNRSKISQKAKQRKQEINQIRAQRSSTR